MNARTSVGAVLAVAALSATVAGCGGGSKTLSKADLATKANAICKAGGDKLNAITPPSNIQDATQAAAFLDKVVPVISDVTNQLAALKPASDIKADWDAFITAQKAESAEFVAVQHKADAKDATGLTDLTSKVPALEQTVNTAAAKVGATGCSSSSQ